MAAIDKRGHEIMVGDVVMWRKPDTTTKVKCLVTNIKQDDTLTLSNIKKDTFDAYPEDCEILL